LTDVANLFANGCPEKGFGITIPKKGENIALSGNIQLLGN